MLITPVPLITIVIKAHIQEQQAQEPIAAIVEAVEDIVA
jgi:hypothetical protein